MPDVSMQVTVSRDLLGLPDLDVNDHYRFAVSGGDQFLGGTVDYDRNQQGSPWINGQVTISRTKQMVTEPISFEVYNKAITRGVKTASQGQLQDNLAELIAAFSQDYFTLTVQLGSSGAIYIYRCEASGYQLKWAGPRAIAQQALIAFQVLRQPDPGHGGV